MGGGFVGFLAHSIIDTLDYPIMRFFKTEIVNELKQVFHTFIKKHFF